MSKIEKASLEAVRATGEKFSKGETVSKNDRVSVMEFIDADMRQGEAGGLPAGEEYSRIRNGNPSANEPCRNIGIDAFVKERYNFENLPTLLNARFGLTKNHTFQEHIDEITGTGKHTESFAGVISSGDLNKSYRWLVREVIMRYVMRGMQRPATSAENLISGTDEVMSDEFKVPSILASDTQPEKWKEGQTIKLGTLKFGEKTAKTFMFGKGMGITDVSMKKMSLDAFSIGLMRMGRDLMVAENKEVLQVLLNGEAASEAAATVGITTAGTLKDRDVWRALHKLEELGYRPDFAIGQSETILDINELPMFRGYDGVKQEGRNINEGLSYTTPNLRTINRSDMAAGKILFGSREAVRKAIFLPYRMEVERRESSLETNIYVSGSTGFYVANEDARVIVDTAQTIVAAPFPASMDLYAANGFK